ncbi:hypothetical protein BV898_00003 [Hypsibius exemplaris]|uniref:Uncharacterized protein n=1 Tax=Hypsibius exemplaris TaxID=2072580 RepID=A0A1W0XEF7_HYPEX|nr:hypothetical protein BV898_00003 [Hypsibius exemplaris]
MVLSRTKHTTFQKFPARDVQAAKYPVREFQTAENLVQELQAVEYPEREYRLHSEFPATTKVNVSHRQGPLGFGRPNA